MARTINNRVFSRGVEHLESRLAVLSGHWAIGSTGAVGAKVGALGLTLARTGTGTYTLQLTDSSGAAARASFILHPIVTVEEADADPTDDTGAYAARVLSVADSTGLITFQTHDEAFVARDPASGAFIRVTVLVKLSSYTR
jgi:hypothetical protein